MMDEKEEKETRQQRVSDLNKKIDPDFYLRLSEDNSSIELRYKGHFLDSFSLKQTNDHILERVRYWATQKDLMQTAEEAR